jgi:hypothetical protein
MSGSRSAGRSSASRACHLTAARSKSAVEHGTQIPSGCRSRPRIAEHPFAGGAACARPSVRARIPWGRARRDHARRRGGSYTVTISMSVSPRFRSECFLPASTFAYDPGRSGHVFAPMVISPLPSTKNSRWL